MKNQQALQPAIPLVAFAQLTKVDEEKRLVYGRAVAEVLDRSGEIFDYSTSKGHFEQWSAETAEATGGKSVGNLRAMHGKVAAGKLTGIEFNDAEKAIDVVAHVVDDQEWTKVLEGVYTGFSIGGSYEKKWADPEVKKADGKPAMRYAAIPSELSLVDRPCVPVAKFFDIQKADGTVVQKEFVEKAAEEGTDSGSSSPEAEDANTSAAGSQNDLEKSASEGASADEVEYQVEGTDEEVAKLAKTMASNGIGLSKVLVYVERGLAKDAQVAEDLEFIKLEEEGSLKKGMYSVRTLAGVLSDLTYLCRDVSAEEAQEGDFDSPLPDRMRSLVSAAGDALLEMVREEVAEVLTTLQPQTNSYGQMVALAEKTGGMEKLEKRNAASALQTLHDLLKNQHSCSCTLEAKESAASADMEKILGEVSKTLDERLEKATADLRKQNADLLEKVLKLESQPAAPRAFIKAIPKGAEDLAAAASGVPEVSPVLKVSTGEVDESATLIKAVHRQGGVPLEKF